MHIVKQYSITIFHLSESASEDILLIDIMGLSFF